MSRLPQFPAAALIASLALASCAGNAVPGASAGNAVRGGSARGDSVRGGAAALAEAKKPKSKIQHVIIIMQENRSFDNLFYKYPGANTATSGLTSSGQRIELKPISLKANYELDHTSADFFAACNGYPVGQNCAMNGFNNEGVAGSTVTCPTNSRSSTSTWRPNTCSPTTCSPRTST